MDAERHRAVLFDRFADVLDLPRHRAPVRVAENHALGSRLHRAAQCFEGIVGIGFVAVEEMLRVVEDPPPLVLQIRDRVPDEFQILGQRDAERVRHVQVPALAEQRDRLGLRRQQRLEIGVLLHRIAGLAGRAEGHHRRMLEGNGLDDPEELDVLRVGARPAALDIVHPQFVELLRHADLVVHGEADVLRLRPVAQSRVVDFQMRPGCMPVSHSALTLPVTDPGRKPRGGCAWPVPGTFPRSHRRS
jgi:hypothetical protein